MLITKKESKQLRYFARANYKADVKGVESENGKVKHREFPCFDLAYDEAKADKGMVELSNIVLGGKPFEGTYADLMASLREILDNPDALCDEELEQDKTLTEQHYEPCLLHGPDCTQEPLPPGPPIVQRLKESETGKNYENMAAAVSELAHPEMKVVKSEIKDLSEDGTLTIDVQAVMSNPVDKVNVEIKPVGDHVEISPVAEIPAEPAPEADSVSDPLGEITGVVNPTFTPEYPVEEPKTKTIIVTGPVCPERHDSGRDYSGLSEEAIAEAYKSVVGEDIGSMKPSVEPPPLEELSGVENPTWSSGGENVEPLNAIHVEATVEKIHKDLEEATQVAEETGKPVITAEQQPKKLTRGELNDLRIKCAVMKLAKSYDEPQDMEIGEIIRRYPDAAMKLNGLYIADGIKPYTISEDAIREAYPDEYEALKK